MFDEFYVEEGYVETGYFVYVARAEALLPAIATKLIAAGVVGDFFVPLDLNANLATQPQVILGAVSDIDSNFNIETTIGFLKETSSNPISQVSVSVDLDVIKTSSSSMSAEFDQNTAGGYLIEPEIELESVATKLTAVAKIGGFFVNAELSSSLTAEAQATKSPKIDLYVNSYINLAKWNSTGRPRNPTLIESPDNVTIDNTIFRRGTGSLRLGNASLLQRPAITYSTPNIPLNEDFSIEFWVRFSEPYNFPQRFNFYYSFLRLSGSSESSQINFQFASFNNRRFLRINRGGTSFGSNDSSTIEYSNNTWYKFELTRTNNTLIGKIADTEVLTVNNFSSSLNNANLVIRTPVVLNDSQFDDYATYENIRIDNLSVRIGDNQVSLSNQDPQNTFGITQQLYYYNNNLDDFLGVTEVTGANLQATSNLSAKTPETIQGAAELDSSFDLVSELSKIEFGEAALSAEFDQTVTVGFIGEATAELNSVFDIQATVGFDKQTTSQLVGEFAIDIEANVIPPILAQATLEIEFDIQATFGFLESATIDLEAVATKLTAAGIVGDFFVPMDVNASIVADANVIKDAEAQFAVEFSQNAEVSRTRTDSAVLESESEVNCLTGFIRDLNASLLGEFELSATPEGIVPGNVSMDAQFSTEIILDLILGTTVDLQAEFDFDSTGNAVFDSSNNLNVAVLLDAQAQVFKIIEIETSMESQFQLTAIGAVSNVRQYVYTIPRENRTINISREDRTIVVRR